MKGVYYSLQSKKIDGVDNYRKFEGRLSLLSIPSNDRVIVMIHYTNQCFGRGFSLIVFCNNDIPMPLYSTYAFLPL